MQIEDKPTRNIGIISIFLCAYSFFWKRIACSKFGIVQAVFPGYFSIAAC